MVTNHHLERMGRDMKPVTIGRPMLLGVTLLSSSAATAAVNLTVTDISPTVQCDISGCSIYFHSYVCSSDPGNWWSFAVGTKWGSGSVYSNCTGYWNSSNSQTFSPGQCKWVMTYGPGFVGPKVGYGTCMYVTSYADMYCQVPETNENDNGYTKMICAQ